MDGLRHFDLSDALALATGAGFCGQCHRIWVCEFDSRDFFLAKPHYRGEQICAYLVAASATDCMSAIIQPYRLP